MKFHLYKTIELLERTPESMQALLSSISPDWTVNNEGGPTWSVYEVVSHLVHCEETDWISRAEMILYGRGNKEFKQVSRVPPQADGKDLNRLLNEFIMLRQANIQKLKQYDLDETHLNRTGTHPVFGPVTLSQLLATWLVHDLDHLGQIARVMAKQYKTEVGPWVEYLRILNTNNSMN